MTTETAAHVSSPTEADMETLEAVGGRSLWSDALHRFMRNRAAVTSVVILVLIVLFTFVGPFFSSWSIAVTAWWCCRSPAIAVQNSPKRASPCCSIAPATTPSSRTQCGSVRTFRGRSCSPCSIARRLRCASN